MPVHTIFGANGIFVPVLRENEEMMYQFEYDYRFDSSKIRSSLGLSATPCATGIATTLDGYSRD